MLQKYEHVLNSQSCSYFCYIIDSKICYKHTVDSGAVERWFSEISGDLASTCTIMINIDDFLTSSTFCFYSQNILLERQVKIF